MEDRWPGRRCRFRVLGATDAIVAALAECTSLAVRTNPARWDESIVIAVVDLEAETDLEQLAATVEGLGLPSDSYGIWVSLRSEELRESVVVPADVFQLLLRVGGSVDFSFITLPD